MAGEAFDIATAAVLGTLQGLTEFLPVSSSGHVALGALLAGVPDMPLAMVVVLHAGTLLATLMVVGKDVVRLTVGTLRGLANPAVFLGSDEGRTVLGVVVASIPTAVIGLSLETTVESWSHVPWIIGVGLLISAAAVLSTRRGQGDLSVPPLGACLIIGALQGMAVLPGISRSGTTIAGAMLLGMRATEAFRFSFLLSLPAVTGALVLQLRAPQTLGALGPAAVVGGITAFGIGWGALLVLRRTLVGGRFWAFALYLVPVGLGVMAWDALR